ncbi:helix-turn-helix domain-containing protein [Streptococcus pasteurianus]|uniref:helix-turn-helix domain-containing protein n=1 Tax=Streptococcus pasteurianus TaxID=197614 RepID=UPI0021B42FC0|nr:helix-turn-helix transcriptional regulator [Streptococcus pasteurianus]
MANNIDKKALGLRIRAIRQEKGMTLEEFGKLFGAGKGLVSRWENGLSVPSPERIKAIAKIGDKTVSELYGSKFNKRTLRNNFVHGVFSLQTIKRLTEEWFSTWFDSNQEENLLNYVSQIDKSYLYRLLGRMVLFKETPLSLKDELNEFERRKQAKQLVIDEISEYIYTTMADNIENLSHSYVSFANLDFTYSTEVYTLLVEATENVAKNDKRLIGFMLSKRVDTLSDEINKFLKADNTGLGLIKNCAYIDPRAIIDTIDYDTYKDIQESLCKTIIIINEKLTNSDFTPTNND